VSLLCRRRDFWRSLSALTPAADALTVECWQQTAVILQITTVGITEHITVDPQELRNTLSRDGDDAIDCTGPPHPRTRELLRPRRL
jgi:hypothetical protein